jgi:16S rRNA (guanine(966)-N(2))-methyltransferase RsmD
MRRQLFDILPDLQGSNVLDLFAGTGIVGLESMCRGAKHVAMVESNPRACRAIQSVLKRNGIHAIIQPQQLAESLHDIEILCCDARKVELNIYYDIIFMDPPYDTGLLEPTLSHLHSLGVCKTSCTLVIRSSKREKQECSWLILKREVQHGDSVLRFYNPYSTD